MKDLSSYNISTPNKSNAICENSFKGNPDKIPNFESGSEVGTLTDDILSNSDNFLNENDHNIQFLSSEIDENKQSHLESLTSQPVTNLQSKSNKFTRKNLGFYEIIKNDFFVLTKFQVTLFVVCL